MKTIILIITFAVLISLQFSCDRCPNEPERNTHYLSVEDKAFLPYADTDTLKFINNADSIDTITFRGILKNYFEQHKVGDECIIQDDSAEVLSIDFVGDNGYKLYVKMHFYYDNTTAKPELSILINDDDFVRLYPLSSPIIDTLVVKNNVYIDVFYFTLSSCDTGYEYKIYFNQIYGIIYFEIDTNCQAWYREL